MERMPDFDRQEKELDDAIFAAFEVWKSFLLQFMAEDELRLVDCGSQFCNHVRRKLKCLEPEEGHAAGGKTFTHDGPQTI